MVSSFFGTCSYQRWSLEPQNLSIGNACNALMTPERLAGILSGRLEEGQVMVQTPANPELVSPSLQLGQDALACIMAFPSLSQFDDA